MRKIAFFSILFLFAMGITTGMVVTFSENAQATDQCTYQCLFTTYCSHNTGSGCTDPNKPYYVYIRSACTGGPLNCPYINELCDCWNGVDPCRARCIPPIL